MNIIVKTASRHYIVRPDTTWERDFEDFFPPEFVSSLGFTPVLTARISKPGRSVGKKFAERYYDFAGFGVLLYPYDLLDGSAEAFACASCLDHTSFIKMPEKPVSELASFKLKTENGTIFEWGKQEEVSAMLEEAISEATKYIYIRTGDLIAIELDEIKPLFSRKGIAQTVVSGEDSFSIVF